MDNIKKIKSYAIGVDIGATNMKAVLFDGKKVIADSVLATPRDTIEHFLIMANALIEPLIEKARQDKVKIKGMGLGLPGIINHKEKRVINLPNLPLLNGLEIEEKLKEKINFPIEIDNDANCFLLAEAKLGLAEKYNNVYGLTLGTGIGSAWWFNNKIYHGCNYGSCEIAHTLIDFTEPITLEKAYQKLNQNNPAQLAEEAYRGDNLAQKSYAEIGRFLGLSLANVVNLIHPEVIIIGGGVIGSSDLFFSEIKNTMHEYIMNPEAKKVKILKSKLGELAGAIGAALLLS